MAKFDESSLENLETLCRIRCSLEEKKSILQNMQKVLEYVEQLKEIDTENVSPCRHLLKTKEHLSLREDVEGELLERSVFLANAPDQVGGMIRTPPILKQE